MNNTYKIVLILSFLSSIFSCKTEQTEVENSKQLKEEIIKELAFKINPNDSIFLVLNRILGVCGNDERYDGIITPIEKLNENKYVRENPYFVDVNKDFNEIYQIKGKTIITGSAFDNKFESRLINFNNDSLKFKKTVYDIHFQSIKADTVYVSIFDFNNSQNKSIKLKMVLNNSIWKNISK